MLYVKGPESEMSNFYPCRIKESDELFKSAEHLYQYKKAIFHNYSSLADYIKKANSAKEAKGLSKCIKKSELSSTWEKQKSEIMFNILCLKFEQVREFRIALLNTRKAKLVHNVVHDFWGTGYMGRGKNHFGELLMRLRSENVYYGSHQ